MTADVFSQLLGDRIRECYFKNNFGNMSKSDLETMLFHCYVENEKRAERPFDDYTLSKQLGITQSRIRSLKERSALKYPEDKPDFSGGILSLIKSAYYNKVDKKIHCFINDVNAQIELRHLLEERDCFDEYSLNPRVMVLTPNAFLKLCDNDGDFNSTLQENKKLISAELTKLKLASSEITEIFKSNNIWIALLCNPVVEDTAFDIISKAVNSVRENENIKTFWSKLCGLFRKK